MITSTESSASVERRDGIDDTVIVFRVDTAGGACDGFCPSNDGTGEEAAGHELLVGAYPEFGVGFSAPATVADRTPSLRGSRAEPLTVVKAVRTAKTRTSVSTRAANNRRHGRLTSPESGNRRVLLLSGGSTRA
jgi:hypothetical protein